LGILKFYKSYWVEWNNFTLLVISSGDAQDVALKIWYKVAMKLLIGASPNCGKILKHQSAAF
jgi:hypothetical protein